MQANEKDLPLSILDNQGYALANWLAHEQIRPPLLRANDRHSCRLPEAANAGIGHNLPELGEGRGVAGRGLPMRDTAQDLGLALGAHLAGVAFAAALMREEVADAHQDVAQIHAV